MDKATTPQSNLLSIVVPCYNEQEGLPIFVNALNEACAQLMSRENGPSTIELIFVDDGSSDSTLHVMKELGTHGDLLFAIRWISFSRNFGKEAALFAGLEAAHGENVATMDVDMQDPPLLLPVMWDAMQTGDWDCIAARRENRRGEPPLRSAFARLFYKIINKLSDADIVDGARDFRLMSRQVVDAVLSMKERNRFTKGIYGWVGFRTKWIAYENVERAAGTSKWNFWSLAKYAIEGIVAFSTAPLGIASFLGIAFCILALGFALFVFARAALFSDPVAGWPSLMVVILLMGGVQLLCLGIVGRYLANIYIEAKHRPVYLVRETSDEKMLAALHRTQ